MARLFDDGVPHRITMASALLTGVPITMACWFNSNDLTPTQTLISISDASASDIFEMKASAGGAFIQIRARRAGNGVANTTAGWSANTWHHACGVFSAIDARAVFLDGGNKGTGVQSEAPINLDITTLGAAGQSGSFFAPMSGRIAEAAMWNVALSDAEVAVLGEGYSPLLVRPQSLVFYAPLVREILDVVGGVTLTNVGTTAGDHTRALYSAPGRLVTPPGAAVTAIASQRLKIGVGR